MGGVFSRKKNKKVDLYAIHDLYDEMDGKLGVNAMSKEEENILKILARDTQKYKEHLEGERVAALTAMVLGRLKKAKAELKSSSGFFKKKDAATLAKIKELDKAIASIAIQTKKRQNKKDPTDILANLEMDDVGPEKTPFNARLDILANIFFENIKTNEKLYEYSQLGLDQNTFNGVNDNEYAAGLTRDDLLLNIREGFRDIFNQESEDTLLQKKYDLVSDIDRALSNKSSTNKLNDVAEIISAKENATVLSSRRDKWASGFWKAVDSVLRFMQLHVPGITGANYLRTMNKTLGSGYKVPTLYAAKVKSDVMKQDDERVKKLEKLTDNYLLYLNSDLIRALTRVVENMVQADFKQFNNQKSSAAEIHENVEKRTLLLDQLNGKRLSPHDQTLYQSKTYEDRLLFIMQLLQRNDNSKSPDSLETIKAMLEKALADKNPDLVKKHQKILALKAELVDNKTNAEKLDKFEDAFIKSPGILVKGADLMLKSIVGEMKRVIDTFNKDHEKQEAVSAKVKMK